MLHSRRSCSSFTTTLLLGILCFASLPGKAVLAQERKEDSQVPAKAEEDSVFERPVAILTTAFPIDALKAAHNYKGTIRKDLSRLHVIVQNYAKEVPSSQEEYKRIKALYARALSYYFRQQYISSVRAHIKNQKLIRALFLKFANYYKERTNAILNDGAAKLVEADIGSEDGSGKPLPASSFHTLRNSFRLRLAYKQTVLAEEMEKNGLHQQAIEHYRLAKIFAIGVLYSLETDDRKRSALEKQYNKDLQDCQGRIAR